MEMRVGNQKRQWDSCRVKDSNSEERAQYLFFHLPTCQSVLQRLCPAFRSRSDFYCAMLSRLFVLLGFFVCFEGEKLVRNRQKQHLIHTHQNSSA